MVIFFLSLSKRKKLSESLIEMNATKQADHLFSPRIDLARAAASGSLQAKAYYTTLSQVFALLRRSLIIRAMRRGAARIDYQSFSKNLDRSLASQRR